MGRSSQYTGTTFGVKAFQKAGYDAQKLPGKIKVNGVCASNPPYELYVHINPLKHGYVSRVIDWPYSTFRYYVAKGVYPENWCGDVNVTVDGGD